MFVAIMLVKTIIFNTYQPFLFIQLYYIYYGTLTSGVSYRPIAHSTAKTFVVGHLLQDVVYVFEVSAGLTGRHSDAVNSKTKFGL